MPNTAECWRRDAAMDALKQISAAGHADVPTV